MKALIEVSLQISGQRHYPGENPDLKPKLTPIAIAGQNVFSVAGSSSAIKSKNICLDYRSLLPSRGHQHLSVSLGLQTR